MYTHQASKRQCITRFMKSRKKKEQKEIKKYIHESQTKAEIKKNGNKEIYINA